MGIVPRMKAAKNRIADKLIVCLGFIVRVCNGQVKTDTPLSYF